MGLRVEGIRDLGGQFAKMAAVKEACESAKIPYPPEVRAYFKWPEESVEVLQQEMDSVNVECAVTKVYCDGSDRLEVQLDKLPSEVKALRITYSY
jgi:hypothetical protein